ncbi:MAG: phosphate uptake regulator PhoU [Anaerovoracaceae bacterium]|nr:phosphate uptake regulator PhoU [Anaerovoracaceae bacterium]
MRIRLDEQLENLNEELISLGVLCEKAISRSIEALRQQATLNEEQISDLNLQIESKERSIEERCIKLLMQQQPVARDLRLISSALKMVTDMKRIGIQAGNIAEIVDINEATSGFKPFKRDLNDDGDMGRVRTGNEISEDDTPSNTQTEEIPPIYQLPELGDEIVRMADATRQMVTESIDAFVNKDEETANKVMAKDDEIDRYFVEIKDEIVERLKKSDVHGERAIDLLMVAKYLERIGDHAENIARWVLYSIEGKVR